MSVVFTCIAINYADISFPDQPNVGNSIMDVSVDNINETIFFFRRLHYIHPLYTGDSKTRDFNFNNRFLESNLARKLRTIIV